MQPSNYIYLDAHDFIQLAQALANKSGNEELRVAHLVMAEIEDLKKKGYVFPFSIVHCLELVPASISKDNIEEACRKLSLLADISEGTAIKHPGVLMAEEIRGFIETGANPNLVLTANSCYQFCGEDLAQLAQEESRTEIEYLHDIARLLHTDAHTEQKLANKLAHPDSRLRRQLALNEKKLNGLLSPAGLAVGGDSFSAQSAGMAYDLKAAVSMLKKRDTVAIHGFINYLRNTQVILEREALSLAVVARNINRVMRMSNLLWITGRRSSGRNNLIYGSQGYSSLGAFLAKNPKMFDLLVSFAVYKTLQQSFGVSILDQGSLTRDMLPATFLFSAAALTYAFNAAEPNPHLRVFIGTSYLKDIINFVYSGYTAAYRTDNEFVSLNRQILTRYAVNMSGGGLTKLLATLRSLHEASGT